MYTKLEYECEVESSDVEEEREEEVGAEEQQFLCDIGGGRIYQTVGRRQAFRPEPICTMNSRSGQFLTSFTHQSHITHTSHCQRISGVGLSKIFRDVLFDSER